MSAFTTRGGEEVGWNPDYIVIRGSSDLPDGFLPSSLESRWFDRSQLPSLEGLSGSAVATATSRFEVRGDGVVAEVFEVRP